MAQIIVCDICGKTFGHKRHNCNRYSLPIADIINERMIIIPKSMDLCDECARQISDIIQEALPNYEKN